MPVNQTDRQAGKQRHAIIQVQETPHRHLHGRPRACVLPSAVRGHLSFLTSSSVPSHSRFQCFSSCFVSSILSVLSSATPRALQGWVDRRVIYPRTRLEGAGVWELCDAPWAS